VCLQAGFLTSFSAFFFDGSLNNDHFLNNYTHYPWNGWQDSSR
jgi:hypothetical protein